jgi:hypothetical protein
MMDPYELLRQKEAELARVRHEIESLQVVAPLLSDDNPSNDLPIKKEISAEKELPDHWNHSQATGTDDLFPSMNAVSRPSFWNSLKRRK